MFDEPRRAASCSRSTTDPLSPERGQHGSSRASSGRSPTAGCRARSARTVTSPPHGYFEPGWRRRARRGRGDHYLEAVRFAAEEDRDALRAQATAALEGAASRSRDIGAHASSAHYLAQAAELAAGEDERLRRGGLRLTELALTSDTPAILAEGTDLLAIGRRNGDRGLQARSASHVASALLDEGRPLEALALLSEVRAALGGFVTEDPEGVGLLAQLGRAHLFAAQAP